MNRRVRWLVRVRRAAAVSRAGSGALAALASPAASAAFASLAAFALFALDAAAEGRAVFGVWVPTAEGAAPPSCGSLPDARMPAMIATSGAIEVTGAGDRVAIRYAEYGATRTIYMNPRNGPPVQEPSSLGVSFGRWEGETLAIFTTYIAGASLGDAGRAALGDAGRAVLGAGATVLERYTPRAGRLEWQATVTDASALAEPLVLRGTRVAEREAPARPDDASPNSAGADCAQP